MTKYAICNEILTNAISDGIFVYNEKLSETAFLEYPYHFILEILIDKKIISSTEMKQVWLGMLPEDLPLDIDTFYDNAILTLLKQQIIKIMH